MDLMLSEDQKLIQEAAREFLAARCPVSHVRAMADDPLGYAPEIWKEMMELGWTGLAVPEDHGGVGAGFLDLCLVVEEMGRCLLPGPFVTSVVESGTTIARVGTEPQRARWLPAIAQGRIVSYVRAGPGGRWGPSGSGVTATATTEGYRLDGTALFVPWAHAASDLLVVARSEGSRHDDLLAVLVDAGSPGLTSTPVETVGLERQCRLEFDRVPVPAAGVLGGPGAGRRVAEMAAAHGAAATCAAMVGGAQQVLDMTVTYACERKQFGRPIGSFQAIQHGCADMAVDVLTSRLVTYEAVWRLSEGLEATEEVSVAKAWVSDAYQRVTARGHQVHGAIGFTKEHDLHLFFRHARMSEVAFGDGAYHRDLIARRLQLP
jgi:alkylation response protein AidB-like acyl-CoA dehydrogenase